MIEALRVLEIKGFMNITGSPRMLHRRTLSPPPNKKGSPNGGPFLFVDGRKMEMRAAVRLSRFDIRVQAEQICRIVFLLDL